MGKNQISTGEKRKKSNTGRTSEKKTEGERFKKKSEGGFRRQSQLRTGASEYEK